MVDSTQKKLKVYKGFDKEYIGSLDIRPLIETSYDEKVDIFNMNDEYARLLMGELMSCNESAYLLYEEFVLMQELGEPLIKLSGFEVILIKNTSFPEYYLLPSSRDNVLNALIEMDVYLHSYDNEQEPSEHVIVAQKFYGDVKYIGDYCFVSYKNHERLLESIRVKEVYEGKLDTSLIENLNITDEDLEYTFELHQEIDSYLNLLAAVLSKKSNKIGLLVKDKHVFNK